MKTMVRIISILLFLIGALYAYIAIVAFFNIEDISTQMIENPPVPLPHQFLPQLKKNLVRNNLLILVFGLSCISGGIFLFYKSKK